MSPIERDPPHLLEGKPTEPDDRAIASLLVKLPPPGADDLSLERIWRSLRARPSRRRSAGRSWLLLPATGLAALCLLWLVRLRLQPTAVPATAQLELTAGTVLTARPRNDWNEASAGATLPEATRLRTDKRGRAMLTAARARVLVSAGTDVGLESLGASTFLRLAGGEVVANVEHRQAGETFTVQTTRYRVTVKGTLFAVRELAEDDVTVSVSRGLVEVAGNAGVWQVPAGHTWHSATPSQLGPDEMLDRDRNLLEQQAGANGPTAPIRVEGPEGMEIEGEGLDLGPAPITWSAPVGRYHFVGTFTAERAEGDASTRVGGAATVRLVAQPLPRAPAPTVNPAPAPAAIPVPTQIAAYAKPQRPARVEAPAAPPAPSAAPPAPASSPAPVVFAPDAYSEALTLSHGGHYQDAAQALEDVAQRGLPHADLALYDLAELRKKQLHDPAGALQAYLRYEREYPRGSLAQEVELSAIELDLKASALPDALAQVDRFLGENPASERAPEIHQLRGNLLRTRGDCAGAIEEYRAAKGEGLDDDSLYFTAWCQQRLGQAAEAASSLREYLKRFPHGLHAGEVRTALDSH
jgi:TolA-binding protein